MATVNESLDDARAGTDAGATRVAMAPDASLFTEAIEDYLRACGVER